MFAIMLIWSETSLYRTAYRCLYRYGVVDSGIHQPLSSLLRLTFVYTSILRCIWLEITTGVRVVLESFTHRG